MTPRAWIITLRGRIREALCPELQVLRDRLAHEATFNNRLCQNIEQANANAGQWRTIAYVAIEREGELALDARRGRFLLDKMQHQQCGPNEGWTLDELYPGDDPASAVDAAMAKSDGRGAA